MRRVYWVGSSRRDLRSFSDDVRDVMGFAPYQAQLDQPHPAIKPLKGLGGGVLEIVANDAGGTFRVVYAVKFKDSLYVLHAFQKKSNSGIKTPRVEMDLIKKRLAWAEGDFKKRSSEDEE